MFDTPYSVVNGTMNPETVNEKYKETQQARTNEYVKVRKHFNKSENEIHYYYGLTDADTLELKSWHVLDENKFYLKTTFVAENGEFYKVHISSDIDSVRQTPIEPEMLMEPLGVKYIDRDQTHLCRYEIIELATQIGTKLGEIAHHYGIKVDSFSSPGKYSNGNIAFRSITRNGFKIFICVDYSYSPKEADYDEIGEDVGLINIVIYQEIPDGMIEHRFFIYIGEDYLLDASDAIINQVFKQLV